MEANYSSYKLTQEAFVSNLKGSTLWEVLVVILPYLLLLYFVSYSVDVSASSNLSVQAFLIEYAILILPLVLFYTVFNAYSYLFLGVVTFSFILSVVQLFRKSNRTFLKIMFSLVLPAQKRPFISYFRSMSNIITVFCILGVDFNVFPRRFAKTETYGFSLMDTGVGFFIISNGLVTKPILRDHLVKSLKTSIPIIILGVVRCVSVNLLDYQRHISEYGVHWNFFFTLAVVKLTCPLILAKWPRGALLSSVALAVFHQIALSKGIQEWIIEDTRRDDILSANKEGLLSLPGYLSLYMAAVQIGKYLLTDNVDLSADLYRVLKLFSFSSLFFLLTCLLLPEYNVSRRLMNITYITWLLFLTFFILGGCLIVEMSVRIFYFVDGKRKQESITPIIIDAVNYNGLAFFLLANILTGVINISMKTLYVTPLNSVLILCTYMLFITFVTCFMLIYRIKISL